MSSGIYNSADTKFMETALNLGLRGMGFTEPNPMVGAVVVKDGKIISFGFHEKYGGKHAERIALEKIDIADSTLYVSLEPCSHHGQTPPCTDIILEKRVKRVVIPMTDPNPKVNGRGVDILKKNGVRVDIGLLEGEARKINRHYLKFISRNIPYITINAGVSIDGKLTDKSRKSQWITGELSRKISHSFRGEFSAILSGIKTVLDDDPQLTIREDGWEGKKFFRVILDTENILNKKLKIFGDEETFPLIIFSARGTEKNGVKAKNHYFIERSDEGVDLGKVLRILSEKKIASILVEGGGAVINSFLKNKFPDEIILFVAGKIIGGVDSVQLFSDGFDLNNPLILREREAIELDEGFILRGWT